MPAPARGIPPALAVCTVAAILAAGGGVLAEPCADVKPPGEFTCSQQKGFGKCDAEWMVSGNYCRATCGRCAAPPPPPSLLTYSLADKPPPPGYVAYKVPSGERIVVDGKLSEGAWQAAPWTADFINILGPNATAPKYATRAKMLWDNANLYIGANLSDPHPWGNYRLHDSPLYLEPAFEVFIDPDWDTYDYLEWEVNVLGVTWDLYLPKPYRSGGQGITNYELVQPSEPTNTQAGVSGAWKPAQTAVFVDGAANNANVVSRGWTVEVAIPWETLKVISNGRPSPPKPGDQWRMQFARTSWDATWNETAQAYQKVPAQSSGAPEGTYDVWAPMYRASLHGPENWGYVQFSNATAGSAAPASGSAAYVPDPAWPARAQLMDVYQAELAFYKRYNRFASSLEELGLQGNGTPVRIQTTDKTFFASADVMLPNPAPGSNKTWARHYVTEAGRLAFDYPDAVPLDPATFNSRW